MTTRRICFTLNNYTEESEKALREEKRFSYLIYGREIGESGTPHLQGYAEFYKPTKYAALAKLHKMHCEVTKGTQAEAILYCKKDGDVYEQGEKREEDGGKKELKR